MLGDVAGALEEMEALFGQFDIEGRTANADAVLGEMLALAPHSVPLRERVVERAERTPATRRGAGRARRARRGPPGGRCRGGRGGRRMPASRRARRRRATDGDAGDAPDRTSISIRWR